MECLSVSLQNRINSSSILQVKTEEGALIIKSMKKFLIASGVAVLAFASIAGAQGTVFSANLTVGSTGADVVALQTALINAGYSIPSIASGAAAKGYFGSQTKTAVQAYQAAKGIPSTGFVGPLTRAAMNAGGSVVVNPGTPVSCPVGYNCTPVGGTTPTNPVITGLAGTDGIIDAVTELSSYSNEEVGDGQNDVKVAGFEIEVSNDGDVAIKSVKVSFDSTGNGGSDNLDDYIDSVSIWQGSTKIGSADASAFNDETSTVWSKTITVNNSIVRADKTEKFYITVDAVGNLDSGDISSDSWTVDVESVRYEDGSGVVSTETVGSFDVGIAFVGFSAAADTELKISLDSSSPDSGVIEADTDNDTNDVLLLVGKIQLKGTSDVVIDQLPITLATVGGSTLQSVASSLKLVLGSDDFSETVSNTGTTTFDNLDYTVDAGTTVTFKVYADINDIDTGTFDEGDTLTASLTATNRDYINVENEDGDQLSDSSEKTGTALGDELAFYSEGIKVTLKSVDADVSADGTNSYNDTGTFKITYRVEAFGDTMYLSDTATATTSATIPDLTLASGGNRFLLDIGGTASTSALTTAVEYTTTGGASDSSNSNIELADGETADVTLTVARTNTSVYANGGLMKVLLKAILWNTDDSASTFNVYDFDLEDYKTSAVSVN